MELMKTRTTVLFLAVIVVTAKLQAQDAPAPNWLSDSSRALQFGVTGNFTLGTFDAKSISFKQHLSDKRAIRIGVNFSGSIDQKGDSHEYFYYDSLTLLSNASYNPTYNLGVSVSAQYLWYMKTVERFFFYLGAGPYASYSRSGPTGTPSSGTWNKNEAWSLGVGGSAGVECFVYSRISLHAEYQALLTYTSTHGSTRYSSASRFETTSTWDKYLNLSSQKVVFGISVYF
jgi:hypothetical protein